MEIHKLNQWVVWRYEGEQKVPYCPRTGSKASVTDPSTWASYEDAELVRREYDGVGFVFTVDDPYCGIDLDDCVYPETGEIAKWASGIVEYLDSYTEITPSDTGIHVIARATKPGPQCKRGNIEIYDSGHYFTFTGWSLGGRTIENRQDEVNELYHSYFPERRTRVRSRERGSRAMMTSYWRRCATPVSGRHSGNCTSMGTSSSIHRRRKRTYTYAGYWRSGLVQMRTVSKSGSGHPRWRTNSTARRTDQYLSLTIEKAIAGCDYFFDKEWNSATPTVRDGITERRLFVLDYAWQGRSGPTDRDVYRALLLAAWKYGQEHGDGIKVSVSDRDLTLQAGLGSNNTTREAVKRLDKIHSLVRCVDKGGKRKSSTYLLCKPDRAKVHHNLRCVSYGAGSRTHSKLPAGYVTRSKLHP